MNRQAEPCASLDRQPAGRPVFAFFPQKVFCKGSVSSSASLAACERGRSQEKHERA